MKDTTRILIAILVMIGIMSIIILLPICHIATKIDTITAIPETVTEAAETPADATNEPEEYTHEINDYHALELNFTLDMEDYKIYDPDELTPEILENRMDGDKVIIERVIGKVTDKRSGAGKIINTADTYYNYISYSNVDFHIEDGTIILSYFIYNSESNGVDDISDRFDFVLDREWED
jgi:hypothetical protein